MELALMLDGQGRQMSISREVSSRSRSFEQPLEDHDMARARIKALHVRANH